MPIDYPPVPVQVVADALNHERDLARLPRFRLDETLTRVAQARLPKPADHVGLEADVRAAGWVVKRVPMRPFWDYNFSECVWDGGRLALSKRNIEQLARGLRVTPREQDPYHTDDFKARWTHVGIAATASKVEIVYGLRE